jgi:intracellular septation protein
MDETRPSPKPDHGVLRLALDYGPLLIFFGVYKYFAPAEPSAIATLGAVIKSTGAFMAAIVVAAIIAKVKIGRISPMMWLTTILVVGFGGLTIWFNNPKFIQIKPTIIYILLASALFIGLYLKKPLMKYVFEAGYDGLSERGWTMLSRNWAWFFAALAIANEVIRAQFSFDDWLSIKVWGVTIVSFLFAAANVPMLMREGLGSDQDESVTSAAEK